MSYYEFTMIKLFFKKLRRFIEINVIACILNSNSILYYSIWTFFNDFI